MRRSVGWTVAIVLVLAAIIRWGATQPPITLQTIAPLLLHADDLPAWYVPGEITEALEPSYYQRHKIREPVLDVVQHIAPREGWLLGGSVGVLVYADGTTAGATFTTLVEEMETEGAVQQSSAIGERAVMRAGHETMLPTMRFVRCRAVVHVTILEDWEVMTNYAQRLDARLQPVVCP